MGGKIRKHDNEEHWGFVQGVRLSFQSLRPEFEGVTIIIPGGANNMHLGCDGCEVLSLTVQI